MAPTLHLDVLAEETDAQPHDAENPVQTMDEERKMKPIEDEDDSGWALHRQWSDSREWIAPPQFPLTIMVWRLAWLAPVLLAQWLLIGVVFCGFGREVARGVREHLR